MDDFSMNISSQNQSYDWTNFTDDSNNYTNNTYDDDYYYEGVANLLVSMLYSFFSYSNNNLADDIYFFNDTLDNSSYSGMASSELMVGIPHYKIFFSQEVMTYIIVSLGVPLTLVAIYSLYTQVSSDHVAPIYVINLLVSDLLQFGLMIVDVKPPANVKIYDIFDNIYSFSLLASVGFMVCVALERYLLIVHPLWYRCRRTIKSTVVVCVLVWLLPLVYILTCYIVDIRVRYIIFGTFLLLPFPLLIFFLVATVKALSASVSLSSEEKRRVVGVLVLVLLIYTLLFLPSVIVLLLDSYTDELFVVSDVFRKLSPLADLLLYVFLRKGVVDKLLAAVCCC